jgi:hypothetical protein
VTTPVRPDTRSPAIFGQTVGLGHVAQPPSFAWGVWWRWLLANVAGEIVGFGLAAVIGALAATTIITLQGVAQAVGMVVAVVLVGTVEGSALGWAQWLVIRRYLPVISGQAWVLATVAGAVLAWGAGMAIGTSFGEAETMPETFGAMIAGAMVIGASAGVVLSTFQWLVLRHAVRGAAWWVPAHAVAWSIGMVVAFAGMSAVEPDTPVAAVAAIGAVSGLAMGALVAAVTGVVLVWWLRRLPETSTLTTDSSRR